MTRPVCIQVYVSREQGARIREAARARELDVSTWVRSLLATACDDADSARRATGVDGRIARHSVFVMVGVDALLAGHPDPTLRERAHQAYARKCGELGLGSPPDRGGSDEA